MGLSALQGRLPGDSAYQFLEQAKVHMLEVLSDYCITCSSHFPRVLNQSLMTLQPSTPKTVLPHSGAAGPASTSQLCPALCPSCIPYISQIPFPHHTAPSSRCGEFHVLEGFSLWSEKQTHFLITSLVLELTAEYSCWDFIGHIPNIPIGTILYIYISQHSYWDFIAKVPVIRARCRITAGIHTM